MTLSHGTGHVFSVTELTTEIKSLLEKQFSFVWLRAEISNFRVPASGHFYFSLKESAARIRAVMFRGQNRRLTFTPQDGMRVIGFGRISLYAPRGEYQIVLEHLEPEGLGALRMAFEQLRDKLAQEGLFDEKHKKTLPFLPQTIALITSLTGSVLYDMLHVLERRFSGLNIEIAPAAVQGDAAPDEITDALDLVNIHGKADVIILARGGGSLEDLWAFNSEQVARAIFKSVIPVVSAIGHETDFTISDCVADVRAPTPSAAAEIVVPQKHDLLQHIDELQQALANRMRQHCNQRRSQLERLKKHIVDPRRQIQMQKAQIAQIRTRLERSAVSMLQRRRDYLQVLTTIIKNNKTIRYIQKLKQEVEGYQLALERSGRQYLKMPQTSLTHLTKRLQDLNPTAVLKRGYSITREQAGGKIVMRAEAVKLGQRLEIILAKGLLEVTTQARTDENPFQFEDLD